MNTDTITVRPRHSVEIVLRYLRLQKELPETTDALIVTNSRDEYAGMSATYHTSHRGPFGDRA